MVKIPAYKLGYETEPDTMLEFAVQSFKQMIRALKKGKVRKPVAYFYSIVSWKFTERHFGELEELGADLDNFKGKILPFWFKVDTKFN